MKIGAIVLAAGKGTRMKSKYPKVLHKILNKPILGYVTDAVKELTDKKPIVVIGHGGEYIKEYFNNIYIYRTQEQQLGTGDAVKAGMDALEDEEAVLVLCGDAPMITADILNTMIEQYIKNEAKAIVLSADIDDSKGYGRIIRLNEGPFERIVEEKDATEKEKQIKEVNSGTYIFDRKLLDEALRGLTNDNSQGEYYLTDVLEMFKNNGHKVEVCKSEDNKVILGINNRVQLEEATILLKRRINEKHMMAGVTFEDSASTYISSEVILGEDVIIGPNVSITGQTIIGDDVAIGPNSIIKDSKIGKGTTILSSIILESELGENCIIGPFAYLRPDNLLGNKVKVGDFVELKKTKVGHGSKIPHHSYIGDAVVGEKVNIGAGTITCNYDGERKYQTIIEDGAFIGSNSNLVAPVVIGQEAYVGAGSTITKDVPTKSLAIGRSRQVNKDNWKKKK